MVACGSGLEGKNIVSVATPSIVARATPDYLTGATISPDKVIWMERHLPKQPGRALDLGCGAGLYAKWLLARGWKVTGVDVAPASVAGLQTLHHDIENGLPFSGGSFDAVLAWDVLEHLASDFTPWKEIARVLVPGGRLLGSVPNDADERLRSHNVVFKHRSDKTHQREYSVMMVEERIRRVSLTLLELRPQGPVSPQVFVEFIRWPWLRRPSARMIGGLRRLGILVFGELFADLFFVAQKEA